ncbi:MAG: hypothetical protein NTW86_19050 [Candidatus Sumerlaeota bacterium]|nr:hypothetical protein [Candidatus Sumerlaeota bacterium]
MPKTKRERILLGVTVALLVIGVAWSRRDSLGALTSWTRGSSESLRLRKQLENYQKTLGKEDSINEGFREIEKQYVRDPTVKPEQKFGEQINALCVKLGFQGRDIQRPVIEDIPSASVVDYGLITLDVTIQGDFDHVVRFLKEADKAGYLIGELQITSTMDNPTLRVELTVARPVRLSDVGYVPGARRPRG